MRYRPLPFTDLIPSVICLGTGGLGGSLDQKASFDLLDAFCDVGGSFIDTAKVYADWLPGERSSSENTIGRWLRARGGRDQVVLATKGAHPDLSSMLVPRMSPEEIVADAEASLSHLGIETIDLYYLHRDDPGREVGEILETLEGLVQAGKIRYYACSNWKRVRIEEAQEYARLHEYQGFSVNQPMWSLAKVEYTHLGDPTLAVMDQEMWNFHDITGMSCVPFSSQANGFFQKMDAGKAEQMSGAQQTMYLTEENRSRFKRLQEVKGRTGLSTTQVVLGYLLAQPFPTVPIVGPHSVEQLRDSLSAAEVSLTAEDIQFLTGGKEV